MGPEPAATGPLVNALPAGKAPEKAFDEVANVFVNDAPSAAGGAPGLGSVDVIAVSGSGSGSGSSSGSGSGSGSDDASGSGSGVEIVSVAPPLVAAPEEASATSSGRRKSELSQEIPMCFT